MLFHVRFRLEMDKKQGQEEEEDDPLDAFMAGIEAQVINLVLI